ncbi:16S rRNA (guanine(527)-N(7))-methyltransferase RsmG [Mycoplasma anatis]|uniref:16S rRNA (guanine(527)-N(7))-methyltransferase RsmG n=1 Tax=Mycoplasmopsis anatis TaxID=171279 RepID=UPI001C4DF920|nr:16S rRNA (guanine(527)-N(7))-methyltransferase RsmG [Mycoplasmopsis anatis]MBW0596028.1 16S rRNA (guanine(527)-N(7))-methyltransferase RsmG [Mycoplasmopsis anatis]MBW0597454.1 16S rRNA (guanine(527)-N(7))-methyltransferase RsmG [Mycoplasmopsis anatis]MBW0600386.1 16S rRNA (guanine(527)-N(7))-methyltransferase RsmG [Mycoplasmopsis anatis]
MTNKEIVINYCKSNNYDFSILEKYVNFIEEKNKVMNLTGFYDDKLWGEGIFESLMYMEKVCKDEENIEILDIGAGVGFPSIPYVLLNNNNKLTIYEPIQKRVNFLNEVIDMFDISDRVKVVRIRSEEVYEKNIFDLIVARAVADIRSMLMSSFHLLKINGKMSLIKGQNYESEIKNASEILKKLKYDIKVDKLDILNSDKNNYIVHLTKLRSTPKEFPYKWKDIKK